ncbi:tRNA (adenine(37)-N6)-methyltransferase isoform X2 [Peromyscus leucopus]|uniref:tRNA (adenine(37)-N6)-methyltransferase isoform X2 n=1 Tax=Peromyscus leucopus TaxID=10041 RepID=UPI0010A18435|nr:tRNA (adenine(37)-N6)-methyltransferase isoform X2 [Peromyscus leucopus]
MFGGAVYLSGIDMIHGTPVLDIKPYIADYDSPQNLQPLEDLTMQNNRHEPRAASQAAGTADSCDQRLLSGCGKAQHCQSAEETPKCLEDRTPEENSRKSRDSTGTQHLVPEDGERRVDLVLESSRGDSVGMAEEQPGPRDPKSSRNEGTDRSGNMDHALALQGSSAETPWASCSAQTADRAPCSAGTADRAPCSAGTADRAPCSAGTADRAPCSAAGTADRAPCSAGTADRAPCSAGTADRAPCSAGTADRAPCSAGTADRAPCSARTADRASCSAAGTADRAPCSARTADRAPCSAAGTADRAPCSAGTADRAPCSAGTADRAPCSAGTADRAPCSAGTADRAPCSAAGTADRAPCSAGTADRAPCSAARTADRAPCSAAGTADRAPCSAVPTWVREAPAASLRVRFTPHADMDLRKLSSGDAGRMPFKYLQSTEEARCAIEAVLSADPRSVYRRKLCQDRLFFFTVDTAHVTCWFGDGFAEVLRIQLASEPVEMTDPEESLVALGS